MAAKGALRGSVVPNVYPAGHVILGGMVVVVLVVVVVESGKERRWICV